ncbi:hypothetical protein PMAYCL1PPCAC_12040, partial [Pristionchus mayeri]
MLLYIISSTFFFFFYSAVFAGNAVVTVTKADIHLKELLVLFHSDEKALIMKDLAYIKRNTLMEMFGRDVYNDRERVAIEPTMQQFVNKVCSTSHLVGFVSNFQSVTHNPHDPFSLPCRLAQIDSFGQFSLDSLVGQAMYGKERPVTFYVGKHLKRRTLKMFNQIILTMYDNEKMANLWWRRYTTRERREDSTTTSMAYEPVPIYTLKTFLMICGGLYALGILIFFVEILVGTIKRRR